jgi:hypothetical protein
MNPYGLYNRKTLSFLLVHMVSFEKIHMDLFVQVRHIILIPNKTVFVRSLNATCLFIREATNTNCIVFVISLRLRFRRNFLSVLHPNLVSSPIKDILEIVYLTPRCIPMDILAWTDCVRSSAGEIS